MSIADLYRNRFSSTDLLVAKNRVWKTLCTHFFSKFISQNDTVLDLGAGYCEFINNIRARDKIAFDMNPDTRSCAAENVRVVNGMVDLIQDSFPPYSVDKIFMSNFLEHMRSREEMESLFHSLHVILKNTGKILILQPNIRYVRHAYWDYFDHRIPLTEKSLIELTRLCDFEPVICIKRFLPYTFKSILPQHPFFVWLYLKAMPFSNNLLGKQTFLVVRKAPHAR